MRLAVRLKNGMQFCRHWSSYASVGGVICSSLLSFSVPTEARAYLSEQSCSRDAYAALPSEPVALTRIERDAQGTYHVMWPLYAGPEVKDLPPLAKKLQTGAEFDVVRCLPPGRWVAVGHGTVDAHNGALVEGQLSAAGESVAVNRGIADSVVSSGNLFPTPMVGDYVVVRKTEISQKPNITPRVELTAAELFLSNGRNSGVELTGAGQNKLRSVLTNQFASARGRLLIEVHARRSGSRALLRQMTTQRAKSIERFLRYEFEFEPSQVVSVGMGSDTYVAGFVDAGVESDVVVLKMIPDQARAH